MDRDKLSKYRAEIIERFINVETIIDAIICQHYFKKVVSNFFFEVLYDEYFTFGLKRRILKKIIKDIDKQREDELGRLNNIRNYFAHYNQKFFGNKDLELQNGKVKQKVEGIVIDPRNTKEKIDFSALYEEFMDKVVIVEEYLSKTYQDLGGKFLKG